MMTMPHFFFQFSNFYYNYLYIMDVHRSSLTARPGAWDILNFSAYLSVMTRVYRCLLQCTLYSTLSLFLIFMDLASFLLVVSRKPFISLILRGMWLSLSLPGRGWKGLCLLIEVINRLNGRFQNDKRDQNQSQPCTLGSFSVKQYH